MAGSDGTFLISVIVMILNFCTPTSSQGQEGMLEFCWQQVHQTKMKWWSVKCTTWQHLLLHPTTAVKYICLTL